MTKKIKSAIEALELTRDTRFFIPKTEVLETAINSLKAWDEVLVELEKEKEKEIKWGMDAQAPFYFQKITKIITQKLTEVKQMPSLKCKFFDKWLHKGQITQEEYDAAIKKLDGHNKQIRNDAIKEYIKLVLFKLNNIAEDNDCYFNKDNVDIVSTIMYDLLYQIQKEEENESKDISSAMLETCKTMWKVDTDIVEIGSATPINTTISPEEVKDIAALYNVNQLKSI